MVPIDELPVALLEAKRAARATVSVCLPARNEEATLGDIVATIHRDLVERLPLVDEILVVDDNSTDDTARVAVDAGARVVGEAFILPSQPAGTGKGNVLWKSLYECRGDLVCWVDADIRNFESHFVTRLVAPLLANEATVLTKGYYRRPLHGEATGGGRVTELMARPMLSYLLPQLADFAQPLSGEYAGRRDALASVPFVEGWGVEVGLLIDLVRAYGRAALAEADLGVREHRNKPLDALGPQALAILAAGLRRSGFPPPAGDLAELVRVNDDQQLESVLVEVRERPAMITIPEYRERFGHEPIDSRDPR